MFGVENSPVDLGIVRSLLDGIEPAEGPAVMIEQIRVLEELRGLIAAKQASVTTAFVTARRAEQAATGMPAGKVGLGIPRELGAARRESVFRARHYAGWAQILTTELPCTLAALRSGATSEWRAMLVARETGWLSREDRATVDTDLGPRLEGLSDRAVEAEAQRLAYQVDPHGKAERFRRSAGGAHVTLRPAPDGMCRLGAVLPLVEGVAVYAALSKAADQARAAGDPRARGLVMSQTLVERVTGLTHAADVPLTVNLIMTDQTLFNAGPAANEPATVSGHGPIPAPIARDLVTRAAAATAAGPDDATMVRVRRLVTDPFGRLVTMETTSRDFTPAMAEVVKLRDQRCTTPWCGAPIRHIDHLWPWAEGGPTSLENAGGKCEACNYSSAAPGWSSLPQADGTVRTTLPTGHDATTLARLPVPATTPPDDPPGACSPQPDTESPPISAIQHTARVSSRRRTRQPRAPADL